MQIDYNNIDDLIFKDKKIRNEFPSFKNLFDQWILGKQVPALKFLAQKSRLQMLEKLGLKNNLSILESYFNEAVDVKSIDYRVARHHKIPLKDIECSLNTMVGFTNNFSISRNAEHVYVSFWR